MAETADIRRRTLLLGAAGAGLLLPAAVPALAQSGAADLAHFAPPSLPKV